MHFFRTIFANHWSYKWWERFESFLLGKIVAASIFHRFTNLKNSPSSWKKIPENEFINKMIKYWQTFMETLYAKERNIVALGFFLIVIIKCRPRMHRSLEQKNLCVKVISFFACFFKLIFNQFDTKSFQRPYESTAS